MYKLKVFSRHGTHNMLRESGLMFDKKTLIRLGSETIPRRRFEVEINSVDAIKTSANKLFMKQDFTRAGVNTSNWYFWHENSLAKPICIEGGWMLTKNGCNFNDLSYPIVAKHIYGSRGTGNYKLNDEGELKNWTLKPNRDLSKFIFEEFFKHGREYRLHVTKDGCFYTCRKLLKEGAGERWHRHAENCVWILEDNPKFDKPVNWELIVNDCVKALQAIGADVLAFDAKVQFSKNKVGKIRQNPKFIIIESCSAPSFGDITLQKYIEQIPKIYKNKLDG